jgi:hypothetical protein
LLFCRIIKKREEHQKNVQIHTIPETVQTPTKNTLSSSKLARNSRTHRQPPEQTTIQYTAIQPPINQHLKQNRYTHTPKILTTVEYSIHKTTQKISTNRTHLRSLTRHPATTPTSTASYSSVCYCRNKTEVCYCINICYCRNRQYICNCKNTPNQHRNLHQPLSNLSYKPQLLHSSSFSLLHRNFLLDMILILTSQLVF